MRQPAHAHAPGSAPWTAAALAALVGLLVALLCFAPARWAAHQVERASNGHLQLPNAQGTVWRGHADLVLTGGTGSRDASALARGLNWRLRPGWAQGRPVLNLHLHAPCCTSTPLRLQLTPTWGGATLALDTHSSEWPAQLLAGLGTPWNTLAFEGRLLLRTSGLRLSWAQGRLQTQGELELDALDVHSRLSTLRPLGSYRMQLQSTDESRPAELILSTLQGALRLQGRGQWVGGRLRFNGDAVARPDAAAALSNLLNIIGRRNGLRSVIALG